MEMAALIALIMAFNISFESFRHSYIMTSLKAALTIITATFNKQQLK
jgi:hypothetical protein